MRAVRLGGVFMLRQLASWNKNICPIFAFLDKTVLFIHPIISVAAIGIFPLYF